MSSWNTTQRRPRPSPSILVPAQVQTPWKDGGGTRGRGGAGELPGERPAVARRDHRRGSARTVRRRRRAALRWAAVLFGCGTRPGHDRQGQPRRVRTQPTPARPRKRPRSRGGACRRPDDRSREGSTAPYRGVQAGRGRTCRPRGARSRPPAHRRPPPRARGRRRGPGRPAAPAPPFRAGRGRLRGPAAVLRGQVRQPTPRKKAVPVPLGPIVQPARVHLDRAQRRVGRLAEQATAQALDHVPRRGARRRHVGPVRCVKLTEATNGRTDNERRTVREET